MGARGRFDIEVRAGRVGDVHLLSTSGSESVLRGATLWLSFGR
jgi:hypothetical protein